MSKENIKSLDRTFEFLLRRLKDAQNTMQMRDWAIDLEVGDTVPNEFRDNDSDKEMAIDRPVYKRGYCHPDHPECPRKIEMDKLQAETEEQKKLYGLLEKDRDNLFDSCMEYQVENDKLQAELESKHECIKVLQKEIERLENFLNILPDCQLQTYLKGQNDD